MNEALSDWPYLLSEWRLIYHSRRQVGLTDLQITDLLFILSSGESCAYHPVALWNLLLEITGYFQRLWQFAHSRMCLPDPNSCNIYVIGLVINLFSIQSVLFHASPLSKRDHSCRIFHPLRALSLWEKLEMVSCFWLGQFCMRLTRKQLSHWN